MAYPHTKSQIQSLVVEKKILSKAEGTLEIIVSGSDEKQATFDEKLDREEGSFVDMRFLGKAPRLDSPTTYDAAFILSSERVRGIGYSDIERKNFRRRKQDIPKGWHQNICDPNLPVNTEGQNIHAPLEDFNPTEFNDFVAKVAKIWHIDLGWEWEGGLFS